MVDTANDMGLPPASDEPSHGSPNHSGGYPTSDTASSSALASHGYASEQQASGIQIRRVYRPLPRNAVDQRQILKLRVEKLPPTIDAHGVWDMFKSYGTIENIDVVPSRNSEQSMAYVIYKPPPLHHFPEYLRFTTAGNRSNWRVKIIPLDGCGEFYEVGNTGQQYPARLELHAESLGFSVLYSPESLKVFKTIEKADTQPIVLGLNIMRRCLEVEFAQEQKYRFVLSFDAKFKLIQNQEMDNKGLFSLIIAAETPPEFSRNYEARSHIANKMNWNKRDAWFRVVDLARDTNEMVNHPTSLHDRSKRLQLGTWTAYRLTFSKSTAQSLQAGYFFAALEDFNLKPLDDVSLTLVDHEVKSVFDLMSSHEHEDNVSDLSSSFIKVYLDPQVRYQLEVCISEGMLSEYNLDRRFLETLQSMGSKHARALLVGVAAQKRRIFDPMTIFQSIRIKNDQPDLPEYCFYARSAVVTPTTMYVATPSMDISNRVIRRYREHTDRFLRVRFEEERPRRRIVSSTSAHMDSIYIKIKSVLMQGIVIGDRHYQFLAWGNSQLREHTAYFFCSTGTITPYSIRNWMGTPEDKVVAKYAARLGQCFSTTRTFHGKKCNTTDIDDCKTKDGKFNFTDGIGLISPFAAQLAADSMKVTHVDGSPPSALQFRLGGCKGVLAIWPPKVTGLKADIAVRNSQQKFRTQELRLEIIRWSKFSSAYLNRQFIIILSTLGVGDEIFISKLDSQLAQLDMAMGDPKMAVKLLQKDIDPNQVSLEVATMVNNDFQTISEPFVLAILHLWRAYTIKYLKEKARIPIHKGAHLLGVVDESGQLRGHFDEDQELLQKELQRIRKLPCQSDAEKEEVQRELEKLNLPEIFVQIEQPEGETRETKPKIIEGVVVLARHPALYPSDIRVVRAVNRDHLKNLHGLRNVVVMPKTGDRDLPSMCSGGDLDGDDFVVIWDPELIPMEWNPAPADFTPPAPFEVEHTISVDDVATFFVQYIKNDSLGAIANAHLAWADRSPMRARDPHCIELADLASIAVDYPKSGCAAQMQPHLVPREWPHFMEKNKRSYDSMTVLGKLYDRVRKVNFTPDYSLPFDKRILDVSTSDEVILSEAEMIKGEYDRAIRHIMAQHGIKSELEIWSTFVLHHESLSNDFKFHEEIGGLSSSLKETFRNRCFDAAGGREFDKIAPFAAAMYKCTHRQIKNALTRIEKCESSAEAPMPFISFPWIFSSVLGDIATGRSFTTATDTAKILAEHLSKYKLDKQEATRDKAANENEA